MSLESSTSSGAELALHGLVLSLPLPGSVQGRIMGQQGLLAAVQGSAAVCWVCRHSGSARTALEHTAHPRRRL